MNLSKGLYVTSNEATLLFGLNEKEFITSFSALILSLSSATFNKNWSIGTNSLLRSSFLFFLMAGYNRFFSCLYMGILYYLTSASIAVESVSRVKPLLNLISDGSLTMQSFDAEGYRICEENAFLTIRLLADLAFSSSSLCLSSSSFKIYSSLALRTAMIGLSYAFFFKMDSNNVLIDSVMLWSLTLYSVFAIF